MLARRWGLGGRLALAGIALAVTLVPFFRPLPAAAHPLGNFTVNRYARLEISPEQVRVRYVLDMAEIPTFQELDRIDLNKDGQIDETERLRYTRVKLHELQRGLRFTVNGKSTVLELSPGSHELVLSPGQAGLSVLRLSAWYAAPVQRPPPGQQNNLLFADSNYANRLGWKEIVVRPTEGVSLVQSSVSSEDQSNELLSYPQGLLKSPLDTRQASFSFAVVPAAGTGLKATDALSEQRAGLAATASVSLAKPEGRFAALMTKDHVTITFVFLALLASVVWGAMHAFTPGHGKTIVAAYLIGSRATAKHAVLLGASVTITHTLVVFALGLVTLFASRFILPEELLPWLNLASGLLVVAAGVWLLRARLRQVGLLRFPLKLSPGLAVASGRVQKASYEHDEHHPHGHEHDHNHSHGGPTHVPRLGQEAKSSLKGLLALGISGGLLPCPAAILIMLSAISVNRIGLGLLLVVAFSVGLAATLTGVGLLVLYGQRLLMRLKLLNGIAFSGQQGAILRVFSIGSAAVVSLIGVVMTGRALSQL